MTSFIDHSRTAWHPGGDPNTTPTVEQIACGALQRIATATEQMAKEHDRLERLAKSAQSSRDYWQSEYDVQRRKLIAARGQITRLKKLLAARTAAEQATDGSEA